LIQEVSKKNIGKILLLCKDCDNIFSIIENREGESLNEL